MSTPGQDSKAPSVAELQKFVREKSKLEFHLINGERMTGTLRWFDEHSFSISQEADGVVTLLRTAVISYRVSG